MVRTINVLFLIFFILGANILSGCGSQSEPDQSLSHLKKHDFKLGKKTFHISLPPEFESKSGLMSVQFQRAGYRVPNHLVFSLNPKPLTPPIREVKLNCAAELRYSVTNPDGGGSGGAEGSLNGHIYFDSMTIGVTASDQSELFLPNPEWCLKFLHTLCLK